MVPRFFDGAGGRTRTGDLLITNQLLYQLSYTSEYEGRHFCRNLFVKMLPYGQSATC